MRKLILLICSLLVLTHLFGQTIPPDYYRLTKKADSLFKSDDYKAAAFSYSEAFKTLGWKGFTDDRYKAACSWALAGYPDSAIFNLERIAYIAAYADITRVANERSFSGLYTHKRWNPLLTKIKSNSDSIVAIDAKLDKALIKKLDSLSKEDQVWRALFRRFENNLIPKDSIDPLIIRRNMIATDSMNTIEARRIFYKYGFPNFDLVGQGGASNFWLLIQHQDGVPSFQDSVLAAMKIEAEKGKASWIDYAYLCDRVKVNTGQLQIYGTQMKLNNDNTSYEPKPVIEPEKLNERRKRVGLNTIEAYAEVMNNRYFGKLQTK